VRTAAISATIHGIVGNKVDPEQLMPKRYRVPPPKKTPEQLEFENQMAWMLLGRWVKGG
jgi:hypothetical protein